MTSRAHCRRFAVLAAVLQVLASCGSLVPAEGPSLLAQRPAIDSGPSAQRRGADGYTQLGAFPLSAAPQLPDATIGTERAQLRSAGATQNGLLPDAAAEYQRSIAEGKAIKLRQQKEVAAALAPDGTSAAPPEPAAQTSEDVLREIEGR